MNQCESIKSYLCNATKYQAFEVVDISDILLSCGPEYTRCVSRQIAFLLTFHNRMVHFKKLKRVSVSGIVGSARGDASDDVQQHHTIVWPGHAS